MTAARTIPTSQNPDLATSTILVEGNAIPQEVSVVSMQVSREIDKIPTAVITISDGDPATGEFQQSNSDLFIPGKTIEIKMGYHSDETTVFKGIITSHAIKIRESQSVLVITCKDEAVKMTVGRKSRHFADMSDSDIATELCSKYNLQSDVESSQVVSKQLLQYWISDWDFIIQRANRMGKLCVVDNGKLVIKSPDLNSSPQLDLLFGATILDFDAEIDAREQWKSLKGKSWNPADQALADADASEPSWQQAGNISASDLAGKANNGEEEIIISTGNFAGDELQSFAKARLMFQRLSKLRGSVSFQGYPQLMPGMFISLDGVGERFNGPVFVRCVTHEQVQGKFITKVCFGLQPSWYTEKISNAGTAGALGVFSSISGLQVGVVTDLEDPEGEERVRVRFPLVSDSEEGVWARLSAPDAGKERGICFRPEVGDEVICGFIGDDPQYAVILGMLNSSAKPAPVKASNDNHEKGYVSREKIKFMFNDKDKSVSFETPKGKKFSINDDSGEIKLEDEYGNKIIMNKDGISIESYKDLNLKAAASLNAKGNASATVEASGTTTIKGSLVNIN